MMRRIVRAGAQLGDVRLELRCKECKPGNGPRISAGLRKIGPQPRVCVRCELVFRGGWSAQLCDSCAAEMKRARYRARDAARRASGLTRRPYDEAAQEVITISMLGNRDGWICWLCEQPVDAVLAYPDPMMASYDHVLPVSRGGGDGWDNLKLAHLVCNVRRGNRDRVTTA